MNKDVVFQNALKWMENNRMYPEYYHGISEQGYDDVPMVCANWWQHKPDGELYTHFGDWFSEYFEIETNWYDEWMACSYCGKAIRQSPDSYSWQASYEWTCDYEVACIECCEDEGVQEEVIEYYSNDTKKAVKDWFYPHLEKHGFICYSPDEYCKVFETGWYPGQNDRPEAVAKDIETELPDYDYIFKIDSVGQFDCSWSVFLRRRVE